MQMECCTRGRQDAGKLCIQTLNVLGLGNAQRFSKINLIGTQRKHLLNHATHC
jgi:hypothetical protein